MLDVIAPGPRPGLVPRRSPIAAPAASARRVGEMGAELGAEVELDRAPLKYEGLSYTEIWISEAQERMVLAVPPDELARAGELCAVRRTSRPPTSAGSCRPAV